MKKISEGEIKAVVSNDSREEIHQYVDRLNGRCFTSDVAVPKLGVRKKLDGFIDKLLADERKKVVEEIEFIREDDSCECDNCNRTRNYLRNPKKELNRIKQKRDSVL